jgi:hypothetical protein
MMMIEAATMVEAGGGSARGGPSKGRVAMNRRPAGVVVVNCVFQDVDEIIVRGRDAAPETMRTARRAGQEDTH